MFCAVFNFHLNITFYKKHKRPKRYSVLKKRTDIENEYLYYKIYMELPDIHAYRSIEEFFNAFIDLNRKDSKTFSLEFFSRKLDWPRSLLDDLSKGRKPLSIQRALEFISYFKLSPENGEKLFYLMLKEKMPNHEPMLKNFFNAEEVNDLFINKEIALDHSVHRNVSYLAVWSFLFLVRKKVPTKVVVDSMKAISYLTEDVVEEAINHLMSKGFILLEDGYWKFLKPVLFLEEHDGLGMSMHGQYAEHLKTFCQLRPQGYLGERSDLNALFFQIPDSEYIKFRKKLMKFRNTLYRLGEESKLLPSSPQDLVGIYQCDLNIFPILDRNTLAKSLEKS